MYFVVANGYTKQHMFIKYICWKRTSVDNCSAISLSRTLHTVKLFSESMRWSTHFDYDRRAGLNAHTQKHFQKTKLDVFFSRKKANRYRIVLRFSFSEHVDEHFFAAIETSLHSKQRLSLQHQTHNCNCFCFGKKYMFRILVNYI